ncbi:hypothetical protein GCM10010435_44470 [Winogradskya consettensis]|uniref:Uncharacterized protein n=1 Tax=Winogradskya consettensis TaxID=113560 RepID=A0A919W115_9ACTN|nr:hypothetical protein [Actinoplanes consettensis]GIM82706.1 hypothetical protein Aco04nite_82860 [Actinoplanes consettensis]
MQRTQAVSVLGQSELLGDILLGPFRLTAGDRPDEAPGIVVLVLGDLDRLAAL